MTTVFKLLWVAVNVAVVAVILAFRNKDKDHSTQQETQQQEPPE